MSTWLKCNFYIVFNILLEYIIQGECFSLFQSERDRKTEGKTNKTVFHPFFLSFFLPFFLSVFLWLERFPAPPGSKGHLPQQTDRSSLISPSSSSTTSSSPSPSPSLAPPLRPPARLPDPGVGSSLLVSDRLMSHASILESRLIKPAGRPAYLLTEHTNSGAAPNPLAASINTDTCVNIRTTRGEDPPHTHTHTLHTCLSV